MILLRAFVLLLLGAGLVCFVVYAMTGEVRYRALGLTLVKWTVAAGLFFFAVLFLQRLEFWAGATRMTLLRWVVGILTALLASGMVLSFLMFAITDSGLWIERARRLRHWTWLAMLFWFNSEIWGRVGWTLLHWSA